MPGNAFIKFATVAKGEAFQEGHEGSKGWIEIGDWSWDIEAESSYTKGGGAAVGKATPGVFSFTHFFDLSSPVIMKNIVKGVHFGTVEVEMCKQTGDASGVPQVYFTIKLVDAFTTKVSTKGGEDGSVSQDVEMVAKSILITYKPQDNKGKLGTAIPFEWDIAKNTIVQ